MAQDSDLVIIENAQLIFRNFKGEKKKFNQEGARNFAVLLDDDTANAMHADGWNVKWLQPREDDDPEAKPQAFLQIKLNYDSGTPPRVVLITSRGRTDRFEEDVAELDAVNIISADMIFRPWPYDINGRKGISAYLKSLYVTIEEDYLELKYAELDRQ